MKTGRLKRLARLGVIAATLASLPGYGLAGAGLVRDCPAHGSASAADAVPSAMDMSGTDVARMEMPTMSMNGVAGPHECCAGTAGHGPTGQHAANQGAPDPHAPGHGGGCAACLAGHGCKSTSDVQLLQAVVMLQLSNHQVAIARLVPLALLRSPDGLLRPPDLS